MDRGIGSSPAATSTGSWASRGRFPPTAEGPIRKAIKEQRETFKPLREAVDEARREAADVLVEEPFSKDKLKEAFDKINEADVKLKSAGQAMLLSTAESLTPDERRALKDWWEKRHARWSRGRDDRAAQGRGVRRTRRTAARA